MAKLTKSPEQLLVGATVKAIRPMTKKEMDEQCWDVGRVHAAPTVVEFTNGVKIFPSRDEEGNGAGCLFGEYKKAGFYVFPD
jgi:hypothetical protein